MRYNKGWTHSSQKSSTFSQPYVLCLRKGLLCVCMSAAVCQIPHLWRCKWDWDSGPSSNYVHTEEQTRRSLTFCLLQALFCHETPLTEKHAHTPTCWMWTTQTPCCARHQLVMQISLLNKTVKAWNKISIKLISKEMHTCTTHTHTGRDYLK